VSAATQAIVAAEVGHLQLAHDYWAECAFTDLHDLHGNVDSGLHMAAMAGAWLVAVAGFGGMRDHDGILCFAPRLPPLLSRLAFRMRFAGRIIEVEVRRAADALGSDAPEGTVIAAGEQAATYRLLEGEALQTSHHGEPVELRPGESVTLDVPVLAGVAPVTQPAGRHPTARMRTSD
jgi:alpha,alpha-trehalose phosphorylase